MITVDIRIDQQRIDLLFSRLGRMAGTEVLRPPMEASLELLRSYMADTYPPPFTGKMVYKTERQRRYVMWAIRNGVIKVPYVRTGKLGQSWDYRITVSGNGLRGEVGPGIDYAKWVQSSELQARIHQGRWRTDMDAVSANRSQIGKRFAQAIRAALAAGGHL